MCCSLGSIQNFVNEDNQHTTILFGIVWLARQYSCLFATCGAPCLTPFPNRYVNRLNLACSMCISKTITINLWYDNPALLSQYYSQTPVIFICYKKGLGVQSNVTYNFNDKLGGENSGGTFNKQSILIFIARPCETWRYIFWTCFQPMSEFMVWSDKDCSDDISLIKELPHHLLLSFNGPVISSAMMNIQPFSWLIVLRYSCVIKAHHNARIFLPVVDVRLAPGACLSQRYTMPVSYP